MKRFFRQYGRLTLALAAVLAFCAVLPLLFQQSRSIETGSWGLSFRTEGQPPVGNASKEALRRYDAVYLGDETQKKIYLTFDAGYENGCTEPILEALAKHNVKAAFFVVGNYIEQNPDLVRRMLREGHIVGNHTYHHPDMSAISDKASFQKELDSLAALYQEIAENDRDHWPEGWTGSEFTALAGNVGEPEYGDISRGTLLDLLPKAARVQLVSVSADTARTLAGLDGVSRTYQESLSEYEPAGDTVLIVTDTQTLASIGTENYTVLRDYGDVYWDVRMNINDLTENFTTDFILPEAPRYGVGRNNK